MDHRIKTHARFAVLGMQITTKPMSPEIPALWSRFVQREPEIKRVIEPNVTYGVMQTPAGQPDDLHYLAGLPVEDRLSPVPDGMTIVEVPAGQYAVFDFPLSDIGAAFGHILNVWLPSSGYLMANSPMFERYGEDFDPSVPSSRMEAHIPVVLRTDA
jgi:AraC family transcriptional regulator